MGSHDSPTPYTRHTAPPFLTIEQAAESLQCSRSAVEESIKRGEMAKAPGLGERTIRIPREAIWPDTAPPALDFHDRRIAGLLREAQAAAVAAHESAALATEQAAVAQRLIDEAAQVIESKAAPMRARREQAA